MEIETEVKVFKVTKTCNKCRAGDMVPTGMVITTNPVQYQHRCNCCGYQESYKEQYPYIKYVPKNKKGD